MGAPLTIPRRLLTLDEYHTIGAAGVLKEGDRIELIEGEMIEMAPIGSRHLAKVNRLARLLSQCVGNQAIISVQNPIALPPHNEPQPDLALLKPCADDYEGKLPGADDTCSSSKWPIQPWPTIAMRRCRSMRGMVLPRPG